MGGGGSKSSTQTQTSTTSEQKDQRVGATNGGNAIGAGATVTVNQEFPDQVAEAFKQFQDQFHELTSQNTALTGQAITSLAEDQKSDQRILLIALGGAVAVAAVVALGGKKS